MTTWRAAESLLVLDAQLKAGSGAAPPATDPNEWGLKGDDFHDATSDHTPHDFPGWGDQIVTAADFPNRPDLGLDAHQVLDDIRRSRDPRGKYGISNGEIWSNHPVTEHGHSYGPYEWRPYLNADGSKPADLHYGHGHLSVVGDVRADGTQPWATIGAVTVAGEDEDMGQSMGPFEIIEHEPTSICLPPTEEGAADPRPAWVRIWNDLGGEPGQKAAPDYCLRIVAGDGAGGFRGLGKDGAALVRLKSGYAYSFKLNKGETGVSITRAWSDKDGNPLDPTLLDMPEGAQQPTTRQLTFVVERGRVVTA